MILVKKRMEEIYLIDSPLGASELFNLSEVVSETLQL